MVKDFFLAENQQNMQVTILTGLSEFIADKGLIVDIYGGINNMFDEKYSLGNDLNAFGGRFFQPSPERN